MDKQKVRFVGHHHMDYMRTDYMLVIPRKGEVVMLPVNGDFFPYKVMEVIHHPLKFEVTVAVEDMR